MREAIAASLQSYFSKTGRLLEGLPQEQIAQMAELLVRAGEEGRHIYIFGNGGSATTAAHFACDLSKGTIVEGKTRFKVAALAENTALLTAWANDASYEKVFAEQLASLLEPGDVVVAISASGNSASVLAAVELANGRGARTIGLTGFGGGQLRALVDICVIVPSWEYGPVEDAHLVVEHAVTAAVRGAIEREASLSGGIL